MHTELNCGISRGRMVGSCKNGNKQVSLLTLAGGQGEGVPREPRIEYSASFISLPNLLLSQTNLI